MPSTGIALIYGIVSGLVGAMVMAITMMAMGSKVKASAPGVIAEKFLGAESKKPMVMMPVMAIWGLVFAALVVGGIVQANFVGALIVAVIAWLVLNIIMLPMVGAGLFGLSKWGMMPVSSGMMHIIWAVVVWLVYTFLVSIVG